MNEFVDPPKGIYSAHDIPFDELQWPKLGLPGRDRSKYQHVGKNPLLLRTIAEVVSNSLIYDDGMFPSKPAVAFQPLLDDGHEALARLLAESSQPFNGAYPLVVLLPLH